MNNKKLNGYYNYTVILTYIATLFGFMGLFLAMKGDLRLSIVFLMVAGICDMFDGAVASTMKTRTPSEKRFGIQIDSLSDLVSFGILPAAITILAGGAKVYSIIIACFYLLCALIRLAYFNVCEEERQDTEGGKRKYYTGLPVTLSSLIYPFFFLISSYTGLPYDIVLPVLSVLLAVAFVLTFKLIKPGMKGAIVMAFIGTAQFTLLLTTV